jgi:hypothetical protein
VEKPGGFSTRRHHTITLKGWGRGQGSVTLGPLPHHHHLP